MSGAASSTRSRLLVTRRNDVGMYTVTAIPTYPPGLRYRSPVSGRTVTTSWPPAISAATWHAANAAAPAETPTSRPSSRASRRDHASASSSRTRRMRSMIARLRTPGTNDAPIPWLAWGRARHPLDRRGEMELGAEPGQEPLALDAHVVGHRQDQPVASHRGRHRQPDAGVAAGRLDDRGAGLEHAPPLGVLEHRDGDAVLDAPTGIERLELRHHGRAARLGQPIESDHRRVADQLPTRARDPRRRGHM